MQGYRELGPDETITPFGATAPGMALSVSPPAAPGVPEGYRPLDPKEMIRKDAVTPEGYTSSVLPFTYDPQGRRTFDPSVGLLGFLAQAFSGPYDAVSGNIPVIGPTSETDPTQRGYAPMVERGLATSSLMTGTNPAIAAGDRAIPGVMRAGPRPGYTAVPTTQELYDTGDAGYRSLRANQLDLSAQPMVDTGNRLRAGLNRRGLNDINAPNTHLQLDRNLPATAPPGGFNTIDDYLTAMDAFKNVSGTPRDEMAAGTARQAIHETLGGLGPEDVIAGNITPQDAVAQLGQASGNYGAAMRSNNLTGVLDKANTGLLERADLKSAATNSGRNFDNNLRLRVEAFMADPQNVAGLSVAERNALNDVIRGSPTQNFLRWSSNLTGGGGGLGQALVAGAGASQAGLLGAVLAAVPGALLKGGENMLARRGISRVDEMMRMRSPLYQERVAATPPYTSALDQLREYLMPGAPPPLPGRAITPY